MNTEELALHRIALTKIVGVGDIIARNLLKMFGSAEALFAESKSGLLAAGVSPRIATEILNPKLRGLAEEELRFITQNNIAPLFISDTNYPKRLVDCPDAPILLYSKGNMELNVPKVISIVGTRKATTYSAQFCERFLEELTSIFPNLLVVSGLAYGVDILAHRSALRLGLPTIGILAHGLDRIYPPSHRQTADQMLLHGGLLTEFSHGTEPDRYNFVRRNRIVAGMADAVLVLESAEKGGSLITAELATSYYRDVFALPGRVGDSQSAGCNQLIVNNRATLLESAATFVRQMGWGNASERIETKKPVQKVLPLGMSDDEQVVYQALTEGEMQLDMLSVETNLPVQKLLFVLLEMEMKGIVKPVLGGVYRLS